MRKSTREREKNEPTLHYGVSTLNQRKIDIDISIDVGTCVQRQRECVGCFNWQCGLISLRSFRIMFSAVAEKMRQIGSGDRHTHTHTKHSKISANDFFLRSHFYANIVIDVLCKKKWKSKRNRREEEEKNGSFAYKWTEIRSKASSTQIKCANQPQSKMIAVFFRIMLMFLSSCFFLSLIWQQDNFFFFNK